MDEACTLDGEFRHWREDNRDAKVRQMAKVIDRSDLLPISATIDLDAHERIFRDYEGILSGHGSFSQPYLMLAEYVLASSVTEAIRRGYTKPLEIVFDEHDLFGPVMRDRYKTLL